MTEFEKFIKRYEFKRKVFHFVSGLILVILINLEGLVKEQILIMLLIILILTILVSAYIKIKQPKKIIKLIKFIEKPDDLKNFPMKGMVFYLIGVIITMFMFEHVIASAAIIILAVGDPVAFFVGRYYGEKKVIINPKKLIEGTLAGTVAGTLAALIFVQFPLAFFGAAFGMIAETIELELFNLDDNFFIPFVAGTVMWLIQSL